MKATTSWGVGMALAVFALASPVVAQEGLRWESDLKTAQNLARQTNRLVLIHFGGPWCGPCRMLEQKVFSQPGFGAELAADYVAVKVDPNVERAVAREYGIDRVPTDVIATPSGQLIYRITSPNTAADYVNTMGRIAAQARPQPPSAPPAAETPAPQVAADVRHGGQGAAPPAADRYADYYNRRQNVEREPYQPPVQNQPLAQNQAPPSSRQPPMHAAAPPSAPQGAGAAPPADRYATRYGDRYADRAHDAPAANQVDRNPAAPPPQASGEGSAPSQAAPADRYADYHADRNVNDAAGNPAGEQPAERPAPAAEEPGASLEARIPPGSPPLALDGYCPVTLHESKEWRIGDPKWGAIHRGMLYLFISQAEQQKFLASPDHFSPVLRGHDPVLALDQNKAVPGRREYGVFCDGRIYLFASEATRNHFEHNIRRYSADILQAMR